MQQLNQIQSALAGVRNRLGRAQDARAACVADLILSPDDPDLEHELEALRHSISADEIRQAELVAAANHVRTMGVEAAEAARLQGARLAADEAVKAVRATVTPAKKIVAALKALGDALTEIDVHRAHAREAGAEALRQLDVPVDQIRAVLGSTDLPGASQALVTALRRVGLGEIGIVDGQLRRSLPQTMDYRFMLDEVAAMSADRLEAALTALIERETHHHG
jgi:hypothetical protein